MTQRVSAKYLIATLQDARARTLELVNDLDQEQLMGPKLPGVNPLRWEIGHIAYFYEFFILRSLYGCLLYTSPSPRDRQKSRMPSSA